MVPPDSPPVPTRALALVVTVAAVLAALLFQALRPEGRDARFEIDEAEWLTMSVHNALQARGEAGPFEKLPPSPYRDEDGNPWKVGIHQSTFGFMNPLLPKLVFGNLALALGHADFDPAVYPRFAKELPPPQAAQRKARALTRVVPPLEPVRQVVLALAALSAALVLGAAARTAGWTAGALAFALFVASPNVLDHATRVRTDFFPIALGLAGLAIAICGARSLGGARGTGRAAAVAGLLGVVAGLAVGSKLNGALVALLVGAWIAVAWWREGRTADVTVPFWRGVLVPWVVAAVPCVLLYVAFSPHLWPAPLENLGALLEAWEGDLQHQKERYGERLGRADTLVEHVALAARGVVGDHEPFAGHLGLAVGWLLVPLGLTRLVVLACSGVRAAPFALAFVLIVGLGTTLWLPFGRDNFYLAFAAVVALLEALALSWPLALLRRRAGEASS